LNCVNYLDIFKLIKAYLKIKGHFQLKISDKNDKNYIKNHAFFLKWDMMHAAETI